MIDVLAEVLFSIGNGDLDLDEALNQIVKRNGLDEPDGSYARFTKMLYNEGLAQLGLPGKAI